MEFKNSIIYIPNSFEIICIRKKNLNIDKFILYNNIKNIIFLFNKNKFQFDKESYCITIKKEKINLKNKYNINYIDKFLKIFEIYFFIKIKFKGKGFRIKISKKIKLIKFYFGRSHITFYKFKKLKIKKINKYKFLLKNLNPLNLKQIATKIIKIKPMNVFTIRGLRISKQIIFKRKGKKGSYI